MHDTVPSYIIVQHTAVHPSNHHVHLTGSEPEWMSLKPSNLGSQVAVLVRTLHPGGHMLSGGRSLDRVIDSLQTVDKDVAGATVAQLHRGHCRVRREGLVILVAWSRVGRLEGRALISTNRFLIRASLHPRTDTHTCSHTGTHTYVRTARQFPSPHLLEQEIIPPLILSRELGCNF